MQYNLDKGAHSVFALQYHFVQCVKRRKKLLIDVGVVDMIKTKFAEISDEFHADILNIEMDKDHLHMLFKSKPTLDIPKYINALKTISSREVQRKYPSIKKNIVDNRFWSPSYFLATSGQVTLDQIKKYIDNQGKK